LRTKGGGHLWNVTAFLFAERFERSGFFREGEFLKTVHHSLQNQTSEVEGFRKNQGNRRKFIWVMIAGDPRIVRDDKNP
jgi:hypothetical protein